MKVMSSWKVKVKRNTEELMGMLRLKETVDGLAIVNRVR